MRNKYGFSKVALLVAVGVLVIAGGLVYVFSRNSISPSQSGQGGAISTIPPLTNSEALALVKSTWGDCSTDTCSNLAVSVSGSGTSTLVIATYEGLRDDSTAAQRKTTTAAYVNGKWTIGAPMITWQCQSGRGHQDFTTGACN